MTTSRRILSHLAVTAILLASMLGCSRKEEAPPAEEKPPAGVQAARETPKAAPSPSMSQFLRNPVRAKQAKAGQEIRAFFALWQQNLHRRGTTMKIDFQVELEDTFQADQAWQDTNSREILNSLCQANNLVWTITEPNTIRITKKRE
jgi:hypothetical protein